MRVIFEEVDDEYYFEVILSRRDLEHFDTFGGIIGDFIWEGDGIKPMNVYIRKEKESESCHLSKEKKQAVEKDFQRTLSERCTKVSPKSKPSRSLIRKRAGAKKLLPKRKPQRK